MTMRYFFYFAIFISLNGFAEVIIKTVDYQKKTDSLSIVVQFPGKCLPHEVSLVPMGQDGNTYRFYLAITNVEKDPCNAINEVSFETTMKDVKKRPAQVLVSTELTGEKPFLVNLPKHQAVLPMDLKYLAGMHALEVTLMTLSTAKNSDFYVDVECLKGPCEAKIYSLSPEKLSAPQTVKKLRLTLPKLKKNMLLSAKTKTKSLQFVVPASK